MTLADRIEELIAQHGSLRAAARVLECDPGYLSRLKSGEKTEPEDWLLRRMKLRRVVSYERADVGVAASVKPADCGKCIDPAGCTDGVCYRAWCAADERKSLDRPALPGDAELLGTPGVKGLPDAAKLVELWFGEWELILPQDARESFRNDLIPSVRTAGVAIPDGGQR